jgi:hypothetical protein
MVAFAGRALCEHRRGARDRPGVGLSRTGTASWPARSEALHDGPVTGANRSNASRRGGSGDLAGMEGGGFLGGFGGLLDLLTARPARRLAARFHRKQAPRQRLPPGALGKGWSMKSGRRAKVQGSGVIRLPWASRINSAFTNSFYSNHFRGRPSITVVVLL